MRGFPVAVLAALAVLVVPASAGAARPFAVGIGNQPGVAVAASGAAHVAWKRELGTSDVLEYCRVPRGERKCDIRHTFSLGGRTTSGDAIVLAPSRGVVHLLVAGSSAERGALFTSANDGATFAGPYNLGELRGIRQAVMAPAGGFTLLTDFFSVAVARYGLTGAGPAEPTARLGDGSERAIGRLGQVPVAMFVDSVTDRLRTFRYAGGDINSPASWPEGPGIRHTGTVAASSGRHGLWVAYTRRSSFHRVVKVRRLRAGGWGRDRRLNRGDDPLWVQIAQGRSGLMVSWATTKRVRYRTARTGKRWSRTKTLFRSNDAEELRLALGRRGGWMVWDGNELNAGNDTIRIAPVPRPR
jgi:hypothetical protein